MASDDIIVKLTAEISGLEKGMQKGAASVQRLESNVQKSMARVRNVLAALGVAYVAREFVQLADASANLAARIRLVAGSAGNAAKVQKELLDVANRTRVGFESVVTLYTRLGRSADALGISQSRLLKFTETFSQALKISGASTAEASSTVIQLSQALAAGELRGAELNSVLEQGGRAATALAEGLGVPIGALKKMAEAGELTAAKVIAAIESQSQTIQREFNEMPTTVGDALTVVQNKLLNFVGNLDKSSGATKGLVDAVNRLGDVLDDPEFAEGMATALQAIVVAGTAVAETFAWIGRQLAYLKSLSGVDFIDQTIKDGIAKGPQAGGGIGGGSGGIGLMPGSGGGAGSNTPLSRATGRAGTAGGSGTGRNAAAEAIKAEQKAIQDLIADLQFEKTLVGQSAEQQEVMNNLRRLGSSATEEQRVAVEAYTRDLVQAQEAQKLIEETAGAMGKAAAEAVERMAQEAEEFREIWDGIGQSIEGAFADTFVDIVSGAEDAGEAMKRLIAYVLELIAQQLILQAIQGATRGGGGIGGLLASAAGAILGRAGGGPVNAGTPYQVGEHGPELFVPNAGGSIMPSGRMGGSSFSYAPTIYAPGADQSTIATMRTMLAHQKQDILSMMPKVIKENTARGRLH